MYTQRRYPLLRFLSFSYHVPLLIAVYAAIIVALYRYVGWDWLALPTLPVTLMGTAVAFYMGFKGNSAYERMWEARKIWGGIVNTSRTWGIHVTSFVNEPGTFDRIDSSSEVPAETTKIRQELIYRHIAWLGALRTQLRRLKTWEHHHQHRVIEVRKHLNTADMGPERLQKRIEAFLDPQELQWVMARKNQATQLLHKQGQRLKELFNAGYFDDFRHMELAKILETLYTLQGKCERIKNFPLPRQYATANSWFVIIFVTFLPAGILGCMASFNDERIWFVVPASALLAWVYYVWAMVIDYTENPFDGLSNDIPIDALSRTIEIDLREMLHETELPPAAQALHTELVQDALM